MSNYKTRDNWKLESKGFEGVFRYLCLSDSFKCKVYLVTAKNNAEGSYHYDPNIKIENGSCYEVEDLVNSVTRYFDFSSEVVSYLEAIAK